MGSPRIRALATGTLRANCHLVAAAGDVVVIDAGDDPELIARRISDDRLHVRAVIATHGHSDHVGAVARLVESHDVPFLMHPDDRGLLRRVNLFQAMAARGSRIRIPAVDVELRDEMILRFGAVELEVLHTPGHSPGSVCLLAGDELLTGDTLMAAGPGRSDLPGGDLRALRASLAALAQRFPAKTPIRPGHGAPARLGDALAMVEPARAMP